MQLRFFQFRGLLLTALVAQRPGGPLAEGDDLSAVFGPEVVHRLLQPLPPLVQSGLIRGEQVGLLIGLPGVRQIQGGGR